MGNKNDFFLAMGRLARLSQDALKDIPDELSGRERRVATAFLTRIPDQVEDIKSFIEDPHKVSMNHDKRIIHPF